jgi:competence protein ComEC
LACGVATGSGVTRAWREAVEQPLRLSFVAVGHGSCVLVELPNGRALLFDAGRMGEAGAAAVPIASVLWSRRISHLDAVVLSHADADHFNALPELLERFSVGVVYVSPCMFRESVPGLHALRAALDRAQVPLGYLEEGLRLDGGQVALDVLHPPPQGCARAGDGDNANSIVLQLTYGAHRALLTGDLEGAGLDELLTELPVPCDLLLAPHHGSQHSRPAELVRWVRPRIVVISAGASLAIEQAEAAYGQGGAPIYWTDRDGCVEVTSDGERWQVATWR